MGVGPFSSYSPGTIILWSVILTVTCGAFLLSLPIAQETPISLIDTIFTATSATCVTGLFTVPLSHFSFFGHAVLLILIQIGGIGLVTLSLLLMSLILKLGFAAHLIAGQLLELDSWKNLRQSLIFFFLVTISVELLGAFCLMPLLSAEHVPGPKWFYALFHAISSFCNAGIFPSFTREPFLIPAHPGIIIVTFFIILASSLGFFTWYELKEWAVHAMRKKSYRLSLHTKIVLYGSSTLLILSSIIFWICEREHSLIHMKESALIPLISMFQALSYKSTGFSIIDPNTLQISTLLLIMALTTIGSAPGSTGSGIKITTLALFGATIKAALAGKTAVSIRGRQIALDQIFKATSIITLTLGSILLVLFCLSITEPTINFVSLAVETVSAVTNLGVSLGITSQLSPIGKCIIMISMILGRIGTFTLTLALFKRRKESMATFTYPEERVMLG